MPSLLTALQTEYDAMVFEMLSLRQQYDTVRQDLANALYTNDASMRVIARLMKERDDAREALASVHTSLGLPQAAPGGAASEDVEMAAEAPGGALPADVAQQLDDTAARLSSERRARIKQGAQGSESYPTPSTAGGLKEAAAMTSLHQASSPGITALDVSANGQLAVTGGKDKNVLIIDRATEKIEATLRGHKKQVTAVAFSGRSNPPAGAAARELAPPAYAVSASADQTVRVYERQGDAYTHTHTLSGYDAPVTGVDVHPTDTLVGSASRDGAWSLHSLSSGERVLHVTQPDDEDEGGYEYESFAFHPDGQLAATGTAGGVVRVWDLKQGRQSAVFRGFAGAVHTLHFSPNGYLLVAAARGAAQVQVWDLRKLALARTVDAAEGIEQVRYDPTAQLLAVVGADVRVYGGKALELCSTLDTPATATGVQWSPSDGALLVAGLDRQLHTYAL